ncbi:hypothetical protein [Erythrobacter aurantius]|uniref:hypothetical protein n=1 Tax=Erythrobacter aurantius TaxID=2909249 RepID=UPI002079566D|nr:hypothetical protein [Erythrobacter aurantius]
MKGVNFTRRSPGTTEESPPDAAPLGGTKAEANQRLQIGLVGLASMILLIALANVLGTQADRAEEAAVPDAAPTTEPTAAAPQRDPLADAGIVPDIPAEPSPTPTATTAPQPAPSPSDAPPRQ